jgi:threonine/homoserine/homoserine lactone efflux protein
VFEAIKWTGVAYLAFLGAQAVRSAIRGRYELEGDGHPAVAGHPVAGRPLTGYRQGFLSNITDPKVLLFYRVGRCSDSRGGVSW